MGMSLYAPFRGDTRYPSPREKGPRTRTERRHSTGTAWVRHYGPKGSEFGAVFFSYQTPVEAFLPLEGIQLQTVETYSQTTSKHMSRPGSGFPYRDPEGNRWLHLGASERELWEVENWLMDKANGSRRKLPAWLRKRAEETLAERERRSIVIGGTRFEVTNLGGPRVRKYLASGHAYLANGEEEYWSLSPDFSRYCQEEIGMSDADVAELRAFVAKLRGEKA